MADTYDFSGWATKNNLKCADGRIIRRDAFKVNDGKRVPLVWNHQHNSVGDVLGHAILENREDGVYAYGRFNNTTAGQEAKECLKHGDVESLSIWANNLEQVGSDVLHGVIREVSLVLAGANPGAFVESVMVHGEPMDDFDEEGIFYTGDGIFIEHSLDKKKKDEDDEDEDPDEEYDSEEDEDSDDVDDEEDSSDEEGKKEEDPMKKISRGSKKELKHADENSKDEKTVQDVIDTMNEEQKNVLYGLIGAIASDKNNSSDKEEDEDMKHNIFDTEDTQEQNYLSHADMQQIFADAKRLGSLRDAVNENFEEGGVLAHAIPTDGMVGPSSATASQTYGFRDPDMLFPEYKSVNGNTPEWLKRNTEWVSVVMNGVHRTPFSRIKTTYADITEDEARARGYIKGNLKKEEVFTLLKRTTDPQTIYKKQKMDRDDIVDITDFDVVAWIKAEMRIMLDEEIARAILIGDGRLASSDDKIQEAHVRPIVSDVDLFNVKVPVTPVSGEASAKTQINSIIRARKKYKGSGNPTFFTTEDVVTEMLLLEDTIGHKLYKTEQELATALRVSKIVTVEVMEGAKVTIGNAEKNLIGVIVNLNDYNVGADKGGAINLFDDFDIDYNQYKYLMETRISGALIKPFSALTIYADGSNSNSGTDPQG